MTRFDGSPLAGESIDVIGGGFGGLTTAAYLADAGAEVTVIEQQSQLGGAANLIEAEGFRFDTGPSWYLMPDVFERFFDHFERTPDEYYTLKQLDPQYRVFYRDSDPIPGAGKPYGSDLAPCDWVTVTPDRNRTRRTFAAYERGGGKAFDRYLAEAEHTYEVGMEHFVYADRSRFRDLLDLDVIRLGPGLTMLGSMQDHVSTYVENPKLQQLLQYTLVFLGGAPKNTPALYNLMAHVDFDLGVYYPEGGMYSVVEGLVDLGEELGVTYRTDTEVTDIQATTTGLAIQTDRGRRRADRVVANAPPAHVERELLSPAKRDHRLDHWRKQTYAPSALLLYLGIEGDVGPLEHHSLVFPEDWGPHFEAIFDEPAWPDDPAYYLAVPSLTDDSVAPDDHHAVVVLLPIAPDLPDTPDLRREYRDLILDDLAENVGVDLRDRIVLEESMCVEDFAERLNYPKGTALGLAHTLFQTGPMRPSHRARKMDGLYYVGGFTSPGIGVPMAFISGEHAANAVVEDAQGKSPLAPVLGA
ncbi:phytoene desaturase family protein [Halorhabdus amylolytica]|uniref:phytoene desaturase family protein n=1 Tax=Halorhabdus amylolytica TaxID=2559573 RepID=UPI0010A9E557|nr:phytoene desaturase family protein [Halorhabdus amylolytica]